MQKHLKLLNEPKKSKMIQMKQLKLLALCQTASANIFIFSFLILTVNTEKKNEFLRIPSPRRPKLQQHEEVTRFLHQTEEKSKIEEEEEICLRFIHIPD